MGASYVPDWNLPVLGGVDGAAAAAAVSAVDDDDDDWSWFADWDGTDTVGRILLLVGPYLPTNA